jgi:ATP-dependent protease ClpP protease subunit
MAAIISIVGDKRKMYYNSFWMNHPLSEGQADYLQYIKDRVAFLVQLENTMTKILTKYTKLNKIDLHRCEAGELWLNAQDALKKGIIDEIIE